MIVTRNYTFTFNPSIQPATRKETVSLTHPHTHTHKLGVEERKWAIVKQKKNKHLSFHGLKSLPWFANAGHVRLRHLHLRISVHDAKILSGLSC